MTAGAGLDQQERRSVVLSLLFRIAGTPVVAAAGIASAAIVIRATGESTYGLVTLVSTVGLLLPFVDLGIGAVAMNAVSRTRDPRHDPETLDVLRCAYRALALVALALAAFALLVMALDGWETLIGLRAGADDRWAVTLAVIVFAASIPAGLGVRILIGQDRNQLAVVTTVGGSVCGLLLTIAMYAAGVRGIWFVLPALGGALIGHVVATALALRITGIGRAAFEPVTRGITARTLLRGSLWLFVLGVGIPFGLQVQRVVLSHLSTPDQLSEYALMAQIFGIGWSVFSTAAMSFWPIFAKRRSDPRGTVRLWLRASALFGVAALVCSVPLVALSPAVGDLISGDDIHIGRELALAFAALLVVQCLHLPSGVMLVSPSEARWQSWCLGAMAVTSVVGSALVAGDHGAAGVVWVTAATVAACQLVPDATWVPRLVRRRPIVPSPLEGAS
ncbi:MAG: oligosaccharide flippase family protein [Aeromicrobium sp.]